MKCNKCNIPFVLYGKLNELFCQKCRYILEIKPFSPVMIETHNRLKDALNIVERIIEKQISNSHNRRKKQGEFGKEYRKRLRFARKLIQNTRLTVDFKWDT